uniref:Uncharacterized protein n=1 Tax=Panagrolaimus sp. ES5 TaxID=591445 RepID=A0AC34G2R4_9BILA
MLEKFFNEENEPNLFKIPVSIKTKSGDTVKFDAIIQDTMPQGSNNGTIITSHGAPGSHKNFRRLIQYSENKDMLVVSVNFPGCGYTKWKKVSLISKKKKKLFITEFVILFLKVLTFIDDDNLQNDNDERIEFVQQIIDKLNLKEKLIFLSHSRGSENSIKMAANNLVCTFFNLRNTTLMYTVITFDILGKNCWHNSRKSNWD